MTAPFLRWRCPRYWRWPPTRCSAWWTPFLWGRWVLLRLLQCARLAACDAVAGAAVPPLRCCLQPRHAVARLLLLRRRHALPLYLPLPLYRRARMRWLLLESTRRSSRLRLWCSTFWPRLPRPWWPPRWQLATRSGRARSRCRQAARVLLAHWRLRFAACAPPMLQACCCRRNCCGCCWRAAVGAAPQTNAAPVVPHTALPLPPPARRPLAWPPCWAAF